MSPLPSTPMVEVVLFASSFRLSGDHGGQESPNISHALRADRSKTVCGRTGWITEEGLQPADTVCCLRCTGKKAIEITK